MLFKVKNLGRLIIEQSYKVLLTYLGATNIDRALPQFSVELLAYLYNLYFLY